MEPQGYDDCRAAGSQAKVGRAGGEQDGRRPTMAPAASLLPPTFLWLFGSSQGNDQKAHAGLSRFCSKKAVDKEGKNWEVWPPPYANMPKMKPRAHFPKYFFFFTLRDVLRATPPTTFVYLLHALTPACQKNRGWGDLRSLFKILICHMEAAVSSSFIALSDVPFWTVKCVDFAECAQ